MIIKRIKTCKECLLPYSAYYKYNYCKDCFIKLFVNKPKIYTKQEIDELNKQYASKLDTSI